MGTDSPSLISAYEGQIEKLERKKIGIIEKSTQGIEPIKPFETTFKAAMNFLANPWYRMGKRQPASKAFALAHGVPKPSHL